MTDTIILAGATGNLGGRIAHALADRGASVRAIVRPGTAEDKLAALRATGAEIVAARRRTEGGWEVVLVRYGRLAGTSIIRGTRPTTSAAARKARAFSRSAPR